MCIAPRTRQKRPGTRHRATTKHLVLDVHQATSVYSVRESCGRILERRVIGTKARELVALERRLGPNFHVIFEEGTPAEWLHDLLSPHCAKLIICNPRENLAKLNKSDRLDADPLSELLRGRLGCTGCGKRRSPFRRVQIDSTEVDRRRDGAGGRIRVAPACTAMVSRSRSRSLVIAPSASPLPATR